MVRRTAIALTILMMLAPAAAPAAEFLEYYKMGLSAAESQQWTQAAEMMRQAIALQPTAKAKIRKALFFKRYLPHFHLGKALYESGDCRGALEAWVESESQGVVERFPEFQQLQDGRVACRQMANLEEALARALQAVKQAETSAERSRRRLASLPVTDGTAKGLLRRQTEAEASLARVSTRLVAGDVALAEVEAAARVAAESRQEFATLERLAREQRGVQLEQMQSELTAQVEPLIEAANAQLAASDHLSPYPTLVARSRAAVEQALEHARALDDSSLSKSEIEALKTELESTTVALRQATSPPPAALTKAGEAFLAGDYPGVLIALEGNDFTATRAVAHAHLLRAAALFSMYQSTRPGDRDQALLESARTEVRACQRADPRQAPPIAVFSPSFLAFFQESATESTEVGVGDESSRQGT